MNFYTGLSNDNVKIKIFLGEGGKGSKAARADNHAAI
jgi:hypothetical protein